MTSRKPDGEPKGTHRLPYSLLMTATAVVAALCTAAPAVAAGPPVPTAPVATSSASAAGGEAGGTGTSKSGDREVIAGLERHAHPLRTTEPGGSGQDLAALSRMVRGATIVGVGEATHGSKELFALKDRLFRHLVATRGFTTFGMEASWSSGVRLDRWVTSGEGDLRQIMREEFQGGYGIWNNGEFLRLFSWMREYNRNTPDRPLRIMGNDVNDVGPEQYERILDRAGEDHPELLPELRQRYAGLRALPKSVAEREEAMATKPLAERRQFATDAKGAYELLKRAPGVDSWLLQEARAVSQVSSLLAFDFGDEAQQAPMNRQRDRAMAENTVWWQRHIGGKVLVSAHNAHLGYTSPDPTTHPVVQGADLRELVGRDYVSIGTAIHSGRYRATDMRTGQRGVFDTGPAAPGSNEHLLDRVSHHDYYVDLRTARRDPVLNRWLSRDRPTFVVPAGYPNETSQVALGATFDVLVHLHRVEENTEVPGNAATP
ncbi:erythromycin esterase family protein [Streptomyces sp. NPDC048057]|uniref:erythromycin esterase family protein n=1 Tax=Streptomyces sp. NPDC048057 TaxID=3155628 RepID=UPI0033CAF6A1